MKQWITKLASNTKAYITTKGSLPKWFPNNTSRWDGPSEEQAKVLLESFDNIPLNIIEAISDSKVIFTRTGNPKGVEGPFSNIKGFSSKYIMENKKLLSEEDKDSSDY